MLGAATAIRFLSTAAAQPTDLSFITARLQNTQTITAVGNQVNVGDLALLLDASNSTTKVVPNGWNEILSTSIAGTYAQRLTISWRLLTAQDQGDAPQVYTGSATPSVKIMLQFRPNNPINNVAVFDINTETSNSAPSNQILSTDNTGGRWLGIAAFSSTGQMEINRIFGVSPSWSSTNTSIPGVDQGDVSLHVQHKIESGNPGTYTVFMDDDSLNPGSNSLASFFLRLT
jgi:hypothetical protein